MPAGGKESSSVTDVNLHAEGVDSTTDLSTLRVPQLQSLATSLGIAGAAKLRKGELVAAIEAARSTGGAAESAPTLDGIAVEPQQQGGDADVSTQPAADTAAQQPHQAQQVKTSADEPQTELSAAEAEAALQAALDLQTPPTRTRRGSRRVTSVDGGRTVSAAAHVNAGEAGVPGLDSEAGAQPTDTQRSETNEQPQSGAQRDEREATSGAAGASEQAQQSAEGADSGNGDSGLPLRCCASASSRNGLNRPDHGS